MGGLIGRLTDKAAIHYRMLNTSKGYSAQGLRALLDRDIYRKVMMEQMKKTKNLTILESRFVLYNVVSKTLLLMKEKTGYLKSN